MLEKNEYLETLNKELDKNFIGIDEQAIDIAGCITFGFDKEYFKYSMKDQDFNNKAYEQLSISISNFDYYQIPVGYRICNISKDIIQNIIVPEYELNQKTGYYEGKLVSVNLQPNEFLDLPIKYLIYFLITHNKDKLKVNNGKFVYLDKFLNNSDDLDVLMTNFKFIPDEHWADFCNSFSFIKGIGFYLIGNNIYQGISMYYDEDIKRFGYLLNPVMTKLDKSEKLVEDEIDLKDIENSIKFLATLLWKKRIK